MTAYGRPPISIDGAWRATHPSGRCSTKARDAGPVAERLRERGTEHEGDVLDGVVLVDVEIARGPIARSNRP